MDIIYISDSKLKVTLTPDDMEAYALTCDMIDYDNTETRRVFWDILDEAKHQTGFDAASDKVYIQVYPSKNGGCELYITKLFETENERKDTEETVSLEIYGFDQLEALTGACSALRKRVQVNWENSSVFVDLSGKKYYLVLSIEQKRDDLGNILKKRGIRKKEPCYLSILNEYGKRYLYTSLKTYLSEYCRCVCSQNAVEVFDKI